MRVIDRIYIGGEFVQPHGTELFDLHNPTTGKVIGRVKLGDEEDARRAIAAAKRAFPSFSRTSKEDRLAMLRKLSGCATFGAVRQVLQAQAHDCTPGPSASWSTC